MDPGLGLFVLLLFVCFNLIWSLCLLIVILGPLLFRIIIDRCCSTSMPNSCQMRLHETKRLSIMKEMLTGQRDSLKNGRKIFTHYIWQSIGIQTIQRTKTVSNMNWKNSINKWANGMNRRFSKDEIQVPGVGWGGKGPCHQARQP